MWQQCHENEDCVCFVCARVSAEESVRGTVMETLLLSAWENRCTLIFELWSLYRPTAEGRVSTYSLVAMGYFIYDRVLREAFLLFETRIFC